MDRSPTETVERSQNCLYRRQSLDCDGEVVDGFDVVADELALMKNCE
jgi:hypothetical protein